MPYANSHYFAIIEQLMVLPLCLLPWLQVRVSLHFLITNPCILVTAVGAASGSPPVAAGSVPEDVVSL
ncbi:hypothetical protein Taro_054461 [Colocasia esculenta]|uniref:Uncharacterized protein n=1 Tax=Colocasia esculenta TaxID=4460 RepID=A0A843XQM6_COLES|nr:hypothetical protein [Colocasia esculenta]